MLSCSFYVFSAPDKKREHHYHEARAVPDAARPFRVYPATSGGMEYRPELCTQTRAGFTPSTESVLPNRNQ